MPLPGANHFGGPHLKVQRGRGIAERLRFVHLKFSGKRAAKIGPRPDAAYRDKDRYVRCRQCRAILYSIEYAKEVHVRNRNGFVGSFTQVRHVKGWVHGDVEEKACLLIQQITQGARV